MMSELSPVLQATNHPWTRSWLRKWPVCLAWFVQSSEIESLFCSTWWLSDEKFLKLLYVRISFLADVVESSNELFWHGRVADVLVIVSTMSLMPKVLASPAFQKIALGQFRIWVSNAAFFAGRLLASGQMPNDFCRVHKRLHFQDDEFSVENMDWVCLQVSHLQCLTPASQGLGTLEKILGPDRFSEIQVGETSAPPHWSWKYD